MRSPACFLSSVFQLALQLSLASVSCLLLWQPPEVSHCDPLKEETGKFDQTGQGPRICVDSKVGEWPLTYPGFDTDWEFSALFVFLGQAIFYLLVSDPWLWGVTSNKC